MYHATYTLLKSQKYCIPPPSYEDVKMKYSFTFKISTRIAWTATQRIHFVDRTTGDMRLNTNSILDTGVYVG